MLFLWFITLGGTELANPFRLIGSVDILIQIIHTSYQNAKITQLNKFSMAPLVGLDVTARQM